MMLTGCDGAKHLQKQQQSYRNLIADYIRHNPPVIDTNTVFLPGKVDTVFQQVPVTDTTAMQQAKDSLQVALAKKYRDTGDCRRMADESFTTGYEYARYEFQQKKILRPQPDTVKVKIYPTVLMQSLHDRITTLEGELQESHNKKSWLWHFIVSAAVAVILLIICLKLSTAKK